MVAFVFALIALLCSLSTAKVNTCRQRFYKEDWYYCTKFGAPANSKLSVGFRSKLINYTKNMSDGPATVYFEVAIYQDNHFETLEQMVNPTCT